MSAERKAAGQAPAQVLARHRDPIAVATMANVQTEKRVEIYGEHILDLFKAVEMSSVEDKFPLSRVRNSY